MGNFKLSKDFFRREDTHQIAKELLGKYIIRKDNDRLQAGVIVEVEVYDGFLDEASHASKTRTKRNEIMFGEGGFYYVYLIYGMYWNLNVITGKREHPSGILIRALEPIYDSNVEIEKMNFKEKFTLASGPGKLCRWMNIDKCFYGKSVEGNELYLTDSFKGESVSETQIASAKRIGVDYAGKSSHLEWRYFVKNNKYVSKK